MAAASAADRALIASIAVYTSWANTTDRTARTAPARRGIRAALEREIDPDGALSSAELDARVDSAMRARMRLLALRSAQARRHRAA